MRGNGQTGSARAIGIVFLLWNLIGIAAFVGQYLQDPAKLDPYDARLFASMPAWAWLAYAVGVFAGTAATFTLLAGRKLALPLYWASLLAIVVQFGRTFLMTDLIAAKGWWTLLFPAFIIIVAMVQIGFANALRRKGRLV